MIPERKRKENLIKKDYILKDVYKLYAKEVAKPLPLKEFKRYLEIHGDIIKELVIDKGYKTPLFKMGFIKIIKYKNQVINKQGEVVKRKLFINYKATYDYWRSNPDAEQKKIYIYHQNTENGGYKIKFSYIRTRNKLPNKRVYTIRLIRDFSRTAAKKFKNRETDYFLKI